jgi:penicillin-insensitive murein endopeptidase
MKALHVFGILFSFNSFAGEAIGYYSNGSIKHSHSIDDYKKSGVVKLFKSRGQNFGTSDIMRALTGLAKHMKTTYPTIERTQIGDISAVEGGRIPRHKSHQNGLDADVVYYRVNELSQSPQYPEWAEDFVVKSKLTKNFHIERNWEAMKYLVHNHDVGRIFVDSAIKKALCEFANQKGELESETEVLRRLRREDAVHMHHFHLRLKCPAGSPDCESQVEPPEGHGCNF